MLDLATLHFSVETSSLGFGLIMCITRKLWDIILFWIKSDLISNDQMVLRIGRPTNASRPNCRVIVRAFGKKLIGCFKFNSNSSNRKT
jgi:hypothetical protein